MECGKQTTTLKQTHYDHLQNQEQNNLTITREQRKTLKTRIAKLKSLLNSLTEDKEFFREAIQSDIELIYQGYSYKIE